MHLRNTDFARLIVVLGAALLLPAVPALAEKRYRFEIQEGAWEIRPGLKTTVWAYGGSVPGTPIVVEVGERVVIEGVNRLSVSTNIHWHGLVVPNDQDGPGGEIRPGASFRYEFTVDEPGTYWYHSHYRPVLTQMDMGLYAPFIVTAPEDRLYSGDHTLVLDDWYLDPQGRRLEGTVDGEMERYGTLETVNGKTGAAVAPLSFKEGELHKLRFINASTAAVHTLKIKGHSFRVTHTDGHPLVQPYTTDTLTLVPAERLDVEVLATGKAGQSYAIESSRQDRGIVIPLVYGAGKTGTLASPMNPPASKALAGLAGRRPDFVLELGSVDAGGAAGMMGGMNHGGMSHGGMGSAQPFSAESLRWTINGKSFPDTEPLPVTVGKVVKLRVVNNDMSGMMQGHRMDHPIHLHGAYFQVLSINGRAPERELWKDTVNVPNGQYVDLAFVMRNPGDWMLHCHIIDHEDGGMMTVVRAR